jgi:SPP1 gp7 family putative phage head morphogenesis protein
MKLKISPILKRIANIYKTKVPKTVIEVTKRRINRDTLNLITNISDDMRDQIGQVLREGEEEGRTVAATASKLLTTGLDKGIFKSARKRAYLIARTELHRARQWAAVDLYKAADITLVKWIGIPDRICPKCKKMAGHTYHIEEIENQLPPLHPRCRCRLLPSNYDLKILPKRAGVSRMKIVASPDNYKYVIRVKGLKRMAKSVKNMELEKGGSAIEKAAKEYSSVLAELDPVVAGMVQALATKIDPLDLHEKTKENDYPHITVMYGLHTDSPGVAQQALEHIELPIKAAIVGVEIFERDEYDVLVLQANSPTIEEMNDKLGKLPSTTKFKDYHPHITIAYLQKGTGQKYKDMDIGQLIGQVIEITRVDFSDKEHNKTALEKA